MGIPNRDPHPMPVSAPEDIPEVEAQTSRALRFRRANMKRWGKRPCYAVRWEAGTVKKGKFSEIMSAIIP
jgi:hypothetical protein